MKKQLFILFLTITVNFAFAQKNKAAKKTVANTNTSIKSNKPDKEQWRKKGYESRLLGELELSISYYKEILTLDSNDYDAKLSIAHTWLQLKNFNQALTYYTKIYQTDAKDVEALYGMGHCYLSLEDNEKARIYLKEAIDLLPAFIPAHLDLARVLINTGNISEAKQTYFNILRHDSTYSEAWAGAGKMLYWLDKPKSAEYCYKKAMRLDPSNKAFQQEYRDVRNVLLLWITTRLSHIRESEEGLDTKTFLHRYGLSKRVSDQFNISLTSGFENSERAFALRDTTRNFDNTFARVSFIHFNQTLSAFTGYSISDSRLTSYGSSWESRLMLLKKIRIKNNIQFLYDYFFYWNRVDRDYVSESFNISFAGLIFNWDFRTGKVRENYIWDFYTKDKNRFKFHAVSLKYQAFKNPAITFSLDQSFMHYESRSPLYYSPYERFLRGPSLSTYYQYKILYISAGYMYRIDNYGPDFWNGNKLWNVECEFGLSYKNWSMACGGNRYMDPYYKNNSLFLSLRKGL